MGCACAREREAKPQKQRSASPVSTSPSQSDTCQLSASRPQSHTPIRFLDRPLTSYLKVLSASISRHNDKIALAEFVSTKKLCMFRSFPKPTGSALAKARQAFSEEVTRLNNLDHPNIPRMLEAAEDNRNFYIVAEALTGGELLDYLAGMDSVTEALAARIGYQVLSALQYAHNQSTVHGSLRLGYLVLREKPSSEEIQVVLTGFEDARRFSTAKEVKSPSCFIAPEVYSGRKQPQSDIWSCGVILYMILTGSVPLSSAKYASCLAKEKAWTVSFSPESCTEVAVTESARSLLTAMLQWEAAERPSAGECLRHPWITSNSALSSLSSAPIRSSMRNLVEIHACSVLKEALKRYMLTCVCSNSELQRFAVSFAALDRNGDGQISREELLEGFKKLMPKDKALKEVDRVIHLADKNDNGKIDYSEFVLSSCNEKRLLSDENLLAAFNSLDRSRAGVVAIEDLKHLFFLSDSQVQEQLWAELMKFAGKTTSTEINFQEFSRLIRKATL